MTENGINGKSLRELVKRNPQCNWVAKMRLDADDVLAPGYFEYIANDAIVNQLEGSTTAKGESWLGALIASRKLNRLVLGKGVCESGMMQGHIFAGWSVGQAIVVSVPAFEKLGDDIVGGDHTAVGQLLRNEVARKVLHDVDYSSRAGSLPVFDKSANRTENGLTNYNATYDQLDATRSRVLILDVDKTFGQVHPYLVTPLSGHFPWDEFGKLPSCTGSQMETIQARFSYNLGFAFAGMKAVDSVQLIDACLSHNNFRNAAANLFLSAKEDCFQMVQRKQNKTTRP